MKSKKKESRKTTHPAVSSSAPQAGPLYWPYVLAAILALAAVFEAYQPALYGPFVFDDNFLPFRNPRFATHELRPWLIGVRPLLMFSYWVNFELSGGETFSYHALNVLLHAVNAALIFLIVRKILEWAGVEAERLNILAGFAGGLFLLHPVQAESVAYIASRSEDLSGLFFFAAYAVFLYRRSTAISWMRAAAVLVLFAAAAGTKEHTATLPALLLLTDYFWNPGFSLAGIKRNWRLYAPMVVAGALAGLFVMRTLRGATSAGFSVKLFTWYEYFFTQCRAIWVYVRLFLLPVGQNADYDFAVSHTLLQHGAWLGLAALLAGACAAFYFRRKYPLAAFGFFIFLLLLAPTSSFIPIKDPVAERRLYLPIVGLLFIMLEFLRRWKAARTTALVALGGVLLAAAVATYRRSSVWGNAVTLWEDTVEKSPRNARAHFQLAHAYFLEHACDKAAAHYAIAAQNEKPRQDLLVDWALAYDCLNQPEEALTRLRQAAAMRPSAHVYSQIGMVYGKQGKNAEALEALDTAINLNPRYGMSYIYRGGVHLTLKDPAAAAADFKRALAIDPANQSARDALRVAEGQLRGGRCTLRIGVNAMYLIPGEVGGTEIYLRCLLQALAEIDRDNHYVVFTNQETSTDLAPDQANFTVEQQPVHARFRPARILWEQTGLPLRAAAGELDVLWNPGFTGPFLCGCPQVTVFHDMQHKRHPEHFRWFDLPFWRLLLYGSAHLSTRLIAVSAATRDDLLRYYRLPAAEVWSGVDSRFFGITRAPQNYFLAVSTLHPHKNLDGLLRAFAQFHQARPEFRLIIAGLRGFQADELEQLRLSLDLADAVEFTGWVTREMLYRLYAGAFAFLYPTTFEGFGLPLLEALAAGLPAACSRIEPLTTLAGDAALFFEPGNDAAILESMMALATDADLRARLSAAGPPRAAQFSWEASARATLQVLQQAARQTI